MFCPNCRKELPDNARFCPDCGATAVDSLTPPASTPGIAGGTPSVTAGAQTPLVTPGAQATPGVTSGVAAAGAPPVPPSPKMDNRKKGLLAGLGAAAVVAVVAIAVVSFAGPANAEVGIDKQNFPDDNFRTYVADNFDKDGNGKLSQDELDSVTTIDIDGAAKADSKRVSDLTGIGHFRGLRTLNAPHNHLHGLPPDFGDLHDVRVVNITHNDITENIDLSRNTNVEVVYVPTNVNIDVTTPEKTDVKQDDDANMKTIVDEHPDAVDDETKEEVENGEAGGEATDSGDAATTEGDGEETDATATTDDEVAAAGDAENKDSAEASDEASSGDAAAGQKDSADASSAAANVQAALQAKADSLGDADHSVEYLYRARGYDNDPYFEWVVSDDLASGTAIGSRIADFDGDGADELLSVVWRDGKVDLDMYEASGDSAELAATLSNDASIDFPLTEGCGSFEVDASDEGAIYLQWWFHTTPVSDGHEWAVMRVDYDGSRFSAPNVSIGNGSSFSGGQSAVVQGTGGLDFTDLKADMQAMGLDTSRVPDSDQEAGGNTFITSSLSSFDSSLSRISCATASCDLDSFDTQVLEDAGSEWSDPEHLGTFEIGPNVTPRTSA